MARVNYVKSFRGTTKTPTGELRCERCGDPIAKGDPYRWWANRAPGMRGGIKHVRCMRTECAPTQADTTPGRLGEWYRLGEGFEDELNSAETIDEVEAAAESIADQIEAFGQEFIDSAENMEEGFGHATYKSDELRERGDTIMQGAEDVRQAEMPEPVDEDDFDIEDYEGDEDAMKDEIAEKTEQAVETARDNVRDAIANVDIG